MLKNKNRTVKSVNNHKTQIYHKKRSCNHIVSKEWERIYKSLAPIYQDLDGDYMQVDLIDLEFYERWLNGRY